MNMIVRTNINCAFEDIFISEIPTVQMQNEYRPHIEVIVHQQKVVGLLDGGATMCVMAESMYSKIVPAESRRFQPNRLTMRTAAGDKHKILEVDTIEVEYQGETHRVDFCIWELGEPIAIFGVNFWRAFGLYVTSLKE